MNKEPLIHFFQSNLPVSKQTLNDIVAHFEERHFVRNEFLLKEGKVSNDYLFLVEGFMRAYTHDLNGEEVTTNFFTQNRVVFEAASFFMRTISTENIQTVTDCSGYSLTFEKLNMLFHTIPEFREFGRKMLVKEFVAFKQRTLSLINQSAEERYANLILTNNEVFQYAQLKHIASYLGVTDTSLSRIRREFAKK
jgi:CRP-like cAMP-binding protein